jgi:7-cyano-7-deazaguanine reductase
MGPVIAGSAKKDRIFTLTATMRLMGGIKMDERPSNIGHPIASVETIRADVLQTITYQYRLKRDIDILIRQPEYTAVCPMTGLPDMGCICIEYRPNEKIVELKSLKYYLLQYRNVGIFYEHAVNRILDDLVFVLNPKRMKITGEFTARGGIATTVTAACKENQ